MKFNKYIIPLIFVCSLTSCGFLLDTDSESFSDSSEEISSESSQESNVSESKSEEESQTSSESITYSGNFYDGYYSSITTWKNGEELKNKLFELLHDGYTPLAYESNWEINQNADQSLIDFETVNVIYSSQNRDKTDTYNGSKGWQREHAFPATLMTGMLTGDAVKTKGMATDFHNLFAAFETANVTRGNKNFGFADESTEGYTLIPNTDGCKYDKFNYEPGDYDKGRVARALFYMATMYSQGDNALTLKEEYATKGSSSHGNLSDLLIWNKNFAVDRQEMFHNETVYSYVYKGQSQGNRNPFVDYPQLADYVFGDKQNISGSLEQLQPTCLKLEMDKKNVVSYAISEAKREYSLGDQIFYSDFKIIEMNSDFSIGEELKIFNIQNLVDGQQLLQSGTITLTINTPLNDINVDIIVDNNPIEKCNYIHKLTGKTSGQDFENCSTKSNQDNVLTLSGLSWVVRWNKGSVGNNSNKGVTFGSASSPIEGIIFTTTNDINISGKSKINGIYIEGETASASSYNLTIKVNNETVFTGKMSYNGGEAKTYGVKLTQPLTGKVSIILSNVNKAVYINRIAINAV